MTDTEPTIEELRQWSAVELMGQQHTDKMPWDNIWDFSFYHRSSVSKRSIVLIEKDCFK